MTMEELADLIRVVSGNTNGRIDAMRNEANAALMNIQNDLTDVRTDVAAMRQTLDLTPVLSTMQRQIDALTAEVAELKRRAS
jgi:cob(I)alamin adenosyltransferase